MSWKSSHIDTPKSSGVSVSLGNPEFEIFILMWTLKLEGGSSDFREGMGWRRKVQRLAYKGIKFVFESSWKYNPSHRGEFTAEALCGDGSYIPLQNLCPEDCWTLGSVPAGEEGSITPWAARSWALTPS